MGKTAAEVQREIEDLREDTDRVVVELESRIRKALDWRGQIRQHPRFAAGAGAALVGGIALAGYASYGRVQALRKASVSAFRIPVGVEKGGDIRSSSLPLMAERSDGALLKKILYAALTAGVVALATFMARRMVDTIWSKALRERPPGGVVDRFV